MKKNKQKGELILILAAVLFLTIIGGFILWFSVVKNESGDTASQIPSPKIVGKAFLTVDFGNGAKRAFEGEIIDNETIVGILMQASKSGNFSYKLNEKSGLMAIDSFSRSAGKSWHWYLNGKEINDSLGKIIVKDGDNILIKYESR